MAFLCRPSPCFIELAQKCAAFNALGDASGSGLLGYWFETRGRAWGWRNVAHATFLTPDAQTQQKAALRSNLVANVAFFRQWDASAEDKLNILWDRYPTDYFDHETGAAGFQFALWFHHFLAPELLKAHDAKLVTGTDQTNLASLVDWALTQPVRWVNEQPNGGWRFHGYKLTIGTNSGGVGGMGQPTDYGSLRAWSMVGNPPSVAGPWYHCATDYGLTYTTGWMQENGNSGYVYVHAFWTALCAAVERGVSGAEFAWSTVMANVSNLSTFRDQAAADPRHLCFPRNK
jgi:hypothetical protein